MLSKLISTIKQCNPTKNHSRYQEQAIAIVEMMQDLGVKVLFTNGHHRKIAIVDDILYEGSLNILSQNDSCELMHRIDDASSVREMIRFIRLEKWCKSRRLVTQQLATPQPKHLTHSLTYQFFEICSILFACHLL